MNLENVQFVKGIIGTDPILEDGNKQIAFIGRSNVGKSSVINSLLKRKSLVKSSSVPGKTQQINFFLIDDLLYFVDLPGYGYAKLPLKKREKLLKLILWYLTSGEAKTKKTVFIVDSRRGVTGDDADILSVLKSHNHNIVVVANKADKLNQKERAQAEANLKKDLGDMPYILYSSKTGVGREAVLQAIVE